jgi:hypothetical protein
MGKSKFRVMIVPISLKSEYDIQIVTQTETEVILPLNSDI